jgi:hypothetical protein
MFCLSGRILVLGKKRRVCIFPIHYIHEEDIPALLALDERVYAKEYRMSDDLTRRRFQINPYADIVVSDGDQLAGYISVFPILTKMVQKMKTGAFQECDLERSVIPYDHPGYYDLYLESIVIDKARYPHFSSRWLLVALQEHLQRLQKRGIFIRQIVAWAVSPMGRRTLQKWRFCEIIPGIFVYYYQKQGVLLVLTSSLQKGKKQLKSEKWRGSA